MEFEIVESLSSTAFLTALIRFQARQPGIKSIYSDCGTNFIGAEKIIEKALKESATVGESSLTTLTPIEWRTLPPHAPHRGGSWERLIKSTKRILNSVLGVNDVTYEIFRTVLAQAALILNSRPLTNVSDDLNDLTPITPLKLLHPGVNIEADLRLTRLNPVDGDALRFAHERSIHLVRSFWKRWSEEYVTTLRNRKKWDSGRTDLKTGQLVLLGDDLRARKTWKMGRVTEAIPSASDSLVRTARIRTENGRETLRDVRKLIVLECD